MATADSATRPLASSTARLEQPSAYLRRPFLAQALSLCDPLPLSLAAPRPGKRDDAKGLAKRRAVGAAAHLSTRPHICLERCDLGVGLGEDSLITGARHVFLHTHQMLSSSPSRSQWPAGASDGMGGGVGSTIASLTPFRQAAGAWWVQRKGLWAKVLRSW